MQLNLGALHDFLRKYGVADGWIACQLGDLGDVVGGATPSRGESRFWSGGTIPWATPTDLTANDSRFIGQTAECITDAGLSSCAATLLPPGAILYTSRATIGAKAIATVPITTNQGFASFVPKSIDGRYLFYLLDLLTPVIKRLGAGTTFDEVSKRDVRRVACAIPSDPDEQAAIARVLSAVDEIIDRVRLAIDSAENLKAAIQQEFFFSAIGETAYADRPAKALPAGWALVQTAELLEGEPKNGVSPEATTQPPGTPTFSIGAIRDGKIDLENTLHLKFARIPEKVAMAARIRRGDVLIVRGNANPDLVGKAGMIDKFPVGCIYPDIAKRVAFKKTGDHVVSPEFAVIAWNHSVVHNQILRRAKTSNGTLKINNRDVKQIVMPVPTKTEQKCLVDLVSKIESKTRGLKILLAAHRSLKHALMHDLVTGRVRVNKLQPESVRVV
jgi:type I restriction enzyme S subunit